MSEPVYRDALPTGPVRGRAAGLNPGNRFEGESGDGIRLHVLGEHLDELLRETPEGCQVPTRVLRDRSSTVINRVDSPDLNFNWTLNPYRGCEHGCVYCYARPTHEMLGMSCGLDFETTIVAKPDAPRLLERHLAKPSWQGEMIAMSGVTDPYQPIERRLGITRACLEVMADCRQPVGIVTKNRLVIRDRDHLAVLAAHRAARVILSITTLDPALARSMEPRASSPRERLRAIRELTDAGIPTAVMVAPVIPGLTDHEMPAILEAAAAAGATGAAWVMLRLPRQVKTIFLDWLERTRPERAARIEAAVRSTRDGDLDDGRFRHRLRGSGVGAQSVATVFRAFTRRYGLATSTGGLSRSSFRPPEAPGQMRMFD